jgi:hypothetical protein
MRYIVEIIALALLPPLVLGSHAQTVENEPKGRYAFFAFEALSIIALNSAPVQALPVLTSEMVPAAAAVINAAIMASLSSASEMSKKSDSPVV